MLYRKKPLQIEAFPARDALAASAQGGAGLPIWLRDAHEAGQVTFAGDHVRIQTLEGVMRAEIDDMIIRGVRGELYPCKPDVFAATYDPSSKEEAPSPTPAARPAPQLPPQPAAPTLPPTSRTLQAARMALIAMLLPGVALVIAVLAAALTGQDIPAGTMSAVGSMALAIGAIGTGAPVAHGLRHWGAREPSSAVWSAGVASPYPGAAAGGGAWGAAARTDWGAQAAALGGAP